MIIIDSIRNIIKKRKLKKILKEINKPRKYIY